MLTNVSFRMKLLQARRALICIPPQLEESIDTEVVLNVYPYLLLVSSVFLMGTFIVYVIVRELRNVHGTHSLSGLNWFML